MASRFSQLGWALLLFLAACSTGDKAKFSCPVPSEQTARGIYNGSATTPYDATPAKRLVISTGGRSGALCTGTAVSARVILTAAHCFYGVTNPAAISIEDIRASGRTQYGAEKFVVHPDAYKPAPNESIEEISKKAIDPGVDIALIIVKDDIPAPYATVVDLGNRTGETLNILGFGDVTDHGALPSTIQMAPAYFEAFYDTKTSTGYAKDSVIQTKPGNSGAIACQGDSGGPLVIASLGFQALVGVTSGVNKYGCGQATRVDFVRIVSFSAWINQTAGKFLTAYKAGGC